MKRFINITIALLLIFLVVYTFYTLITAMRYEESYLEQIENLKEENYNLKKRVDDLTMELTTCYGRYKVAPRDLPPLPKLE